ncbi:hypothetical protein [Candidatus Dactylopiibacterium carminicum]|uniref:hypothetical protein n=1 Tax=Candidatus Dactylopiibacterium carminicum TaxID=857335 RepID=UPI001140DA39|nr:hypothetical protein [Candidatus Dactylopiibacterium carminicum]
MKQGPPPAEAGLGSSASICRMLSGGLVNRRDLPHGTGKCQGSQRSHHQGQAVRGEILSIDGRILWNFLAQKIAKIPLKPEQQETSCLFLRN